MSNLIQNVLNSDEKKNLREFANLLRQSQKIYLLRKDILISFYKYCGIKEDNKYLYRNSNLGKLIYFSQEIILDKESLYLVIRPQVTSQEVYRLLDNMTVESINIDEWANLQEKLVNCNCSDDGELLKIDFEAFYNSSPSLDDSKEIGNEIDYLHGYLSSKFFENHCTSWQEALFNFLKLYKYNGQQLLINQRIQNKSQLSEKIKRVINLLEVYPAQTPYENFRFELRSFGFEPGWGNTACQARETFLLLDELIDSADQHLLSNFIYRIPNISGENCEDMRHYLELLFHLFYELRAKILLEKHSINSNKVPAFFPFTERVMVGRNTI